MADSFSCSHCGGDLRPDAHFCRHCGSSDSDGWREDEEGYVAEDDFDYESYLEENHGETAANTRTPAGWRLVAVVLLLLFACGFLCF